MQVGQWYAECKNKNVKKVRMAVPISADIITDVIASLQEMIKDPLLH